MLSTDVTKIVISGLKTKIEEDFSQNNRVPSAAVSRLLGPGHFLPTALLC